MMFEKTALLLLVIFFVVVAGTLTELSAQALPTQTSTLFSGSGNCAVCHQPGSPNTAALLAPDGSDVSPVTLWRSTMMANGARDPFWQAKVTAEVAAHPELQAVIEDKCTTCHSPMGRTEAIYLGQSYYSLAEMQADPLAMDGISCTACHQIKNTNLGLDSSFSGHYIIENEHLIYGPFQNPVADPMINGSGYTPVYGKHVTGSELCATCHTLFTPTVNNAGEIVGEAPEQTPYLEWKNSVFPARDIQCQTCHTPVLNDPIVISNRPLTLSGRSPFAKHYFVGGNVFMLTLLRDHASEIGVTATEQHFDSTIARTLRLLQNNTVELSGRFFWEDADTLVIAVAVKNLSGHKFPTGYPSRRAWLVLDLKDATDQSLFTSGNWDAETGEIFGLDSLYEPHYEVIRQPDQVQIYQSVMSDVDGKVNYTLLRAAGYLKDNRIPPEGFLTTGPHYDSTAVEGRAMDDPNFNRSGDREGTGIDTVYYKIGGLNRSGSYRAEIKMVYQSLAPRFVEDLARYNTPEVQTFLNYYRQRVNAPVTLDSLLLAIGSTDVQTEGAGTPRTPLLVKTYPNPFNPETTIELQIARAGQATVVVYNLLGERVQTIFSGYLSPGRHRLKWEATSQNGSRVASGTYIVEVNFQEKYSGKKYRRNRKIVYLK